MALSGACEWHRSTSNNILKPSHFVKLSRVVIEIMWIIVSGSHVCQVFTRLQVNEILHGSHLSPPLEHRMKSKNIIAAVPVFFASINVSSSFQAWGTVTRSISSCQRTLLKSSINADHITSRINFDFSGINSIESDLKSALEKARDADKRYGLCTEPSQQAWSVVDNLYAKMQMFQNQNERSAPTTSEESESSSSNKEHGGNGYYFF